MKRTLQLGLSIVLFSLLLSACSSLVLGPEPTPRPTSAADRAERFWQQQRYAEAAAAWLEAAAQTSAQNQQRFTLYAADAYLHNRQFDNSNLTLKRIDQSRLYEDDRALYNLIAGEIALSNGDTELAKAFLDYDAMLFPPGLRERLAALQAQLQTSAISSPASTALTDFRSRLRNHNSTSVEAITANLRRLDPIPTIELAETASDLRNRDRNLAGWLALTAALRDTLFANQSDSIALWQAEYPNMMLNSQELQQLLAAYRGSFVFPDRVAVILPGSGSLAVPARAIEDGLISAFMATRHSSDIRFYHTDSSEQATVGAYFQAVDDGADWVIGPLNKKAVQRLTSLSGISTPMLALNKPDDFSQVPLELADQIFSFALLPEDEARAAAQRAWQDGHTSAAVLVPNNSWGERLASTFSDTFSEAGGQVSATIRYQANENDHSAQLKNLLNINQSMARKRALQSYLGIPLDFNSQSRTDLDMIFLAATPKQGRLIKPQLKFFDAGHIPVYAASNIFTGMDDKRADDDLNGVFFPFSPWALGQDRRPVPEQTLREALPSIRKGRFSNLFAMGMDAWAVLPYLPMMVHDTQLAYPGASGRLTIGENGTVHRDLAWALFQGGQPQSVE